MNLLGDLLYGSPLVDQAATLPGGVTLEWLSLNAEDVWSQVASEASARPIVPSLSSILAGLAVHPLQRYVTGGFLPILNAAQWRTDFAADPAAPLEDGADSWVEFVGGASGEFGVLMPGSAASELELGLFSSPGPFAGAPAPLRAVFVALGRGLRGGGVTVRIDDDGCGMTLAGECVSDGRCSQGCEKRQHTGRYGEGLRCACPIFGSSGLVLSTGSAYPSTERQPELAEA
jgi:hypothetical protein